MALFDRKTKPAQAADTKPIAALEALSASASSLDARVLKARAAVDEAREEHAAAALDDADSKPGAAARLAKARTALMDASTALADLEAALASVRARDAAQASKAADADAARRWSRVAELAKQREALAVRVERAAAELADAYKELAPIGEEMFSLAPVKDAQNLMDSQVSPAKLVDSLQLQIKRVGFKWAMQRWPWGFDDVPTFAQHVVESNKAILNQRARK